MIQLAPATLSAHGMVELGEEVTVGMSTYGDPRITLTALRSLFLSARGNFELLLIDNHSPEEAVRDLLRQAIAEHPNTTAFSFSENREYSGAVNAILSHARGQAVFFLSNDIFVTPHWFREILVAARANPRHGLVRGSSNFVDNGRTTHQIGISRAPASFEELFTIGKTVADQYPAELLVDDFFVGDAFLVSRALLDRIGTYDPRFFGYFADPDFGVRTQIAGFDQILVRRAFAYHRRDANYHYLPAAQQQARLAQRWERVEANWARFKDKYGLPAAQPYTSVNDIPWKTLAARPFDPAQHYSAPGDYLAERMATRPA